MKTTLSVALAALIAAASFSVPTISSAAGMGAGMGGDYRDYNDYCHHQKKQGQRTGAVIGGILGAVVGSNLAAHHGGRAGGAVLGAAAGAAVGSNVGRSAAKCDDHGGAYWSEEQTYGYRDQAYYHGGGRYDDNYYESRRCRWAWDDYEQSYIRVCPDRDGYYRMMD